MILAWLLLLAVAVGLFAGVLRMTPARAPTIAVPKRVPVFRAHVVDPRNPTH